MPSKNSEGYRAIGFWAEQKKTNGGQTTRFHYMQLQ